MYKINEDLSIYVTRGDIVLTTVKAEFNGKPYTFMPDDLVRFKVFKKKNASAVVLQKDFTIETPTQAVQIFLDRTDTKIGTTISKPVDYWYEVELNPLSDPQTIIGYDEDGAKVFKLFPEGADKEVEGHEPDTEEEELLHKYMDDKLDLSSTHPVENHVIAREILKIGTAIEAVREKAIKTYETVLDMVNDLGLGENDKCATLGYYQVNDGGAALYHVCKEKQNWSEQLGNGLFAHLVRDDFDTIDLRQHGCRCNGVDSDSDRLNELVVIYKTTNKNFVFDGALVLDKALRFDTANITFAGKSQYSSFVYLTTDEACLEFVSASKIYNLTLRDMGIVGNKNNKLLRISGYHNINIRNVVFSNECTDDHPIEILGSVIFVDSCTFDGGSIELTNPTKRMILFSGSIISFLNCNVWNLKSFVTAMQTFYVSVEQCWLENNERIVEYYNHNSTKTYALSVLSIMNSNLIKSGGEFYYLYSDSKNNNLSEQRIHLVGNRNYIANITNTYLSHMVASYPYVILNSTDAVGYEIVDKTNVPEADIIYTGFGHNGKNGGAFSRGTTLSVKKLCLSDTYSSTKNVLYVSGNSLYFIDNDGTVHTIV